MNKEIQETLKDPLYPCAKGIVLEEQNASISMLQRILFIGYNRSARLIEALEHEEVVSPMGKDGIRKVMMTSKNESIRNDIKCPKHETGGGPCYCASQGASELKAGLGRLLAEKRTGTKISAHGVLGRIRDGRYCKELNFACGEMLHHLEEMASRFYSGDVKAVDEFLQLYDLADKRPNGQTNLTLTTKTRTKQYDEPD